MTSKIIYEGGLRTRMTHLQSTTEVLTDAPTDNHGKGEAFSPTDLVATALGACIITTMGIYAQNNSLNIDGATLEVTKIMAAAPRRITRIEVIVTMPKDKSYSEKERSTLENVGHACPIAKSLHPDLEQDIRFVW